MVGKSKQAYSEIVKGGIEVAGVTSIDINSWNVSGYHFCDR